MLRRGPTAKKHQASRPGAHNTADASGKPDRESRQADVEKTKEEKSKNTEKREGGSRQNCPEKQAKGSRKKEGAPGKRKKTLQRLQASRPGAHNTAQHCTTPMVLEDLNPNPSPPKPQTLNPKP